MKLPSHKVSLLATYLPSHQGSILWVLAYKLEVRTYPLRVRSKGGGGRII